MQSMRPIVLSAIGVAIVAVAWLLTQSTAFRPSSSLDNPLGKSFDFDVSRYAKTDPKTIIRDEGKPMTTGQSRLRGIAVGTDDRIYVAGDNSVVTLDRSGSRLANVEVGGPANCIAVDENGDMYLGMRDHVEIYGPTGSRKAAWPVIGTNALLTSIALKPGSVFVADAGKRAVYRFDGSGKLLNKIGEKNKEAGEPGYYVPSPYFDLAIGYDRTLWVVDPGRHEFRNYRDDGERISSWAKASFDIDGFSGCCNPTHIAIMSDGSFVTTEKSLVRVKIHGPDGHLVGVVAGPESFAEGTRGLDVALDSAGRILVLDPSRGTVRVFVEKQSKGQGGGK